MQAAVIVAVRVDVIWDSLPCSLALHHSMLSPHDLLACRSCAHKRTPIGAPDGATHTCNSDLVFSHVRCNASQEVLKSHCR